MTNKEIALSYLNKGLSIIPLYSPSLLKRKPPKKFAEKLNRKLAKNTQSENPLSEEEIIRKAVIAQCKVPAIWTWADYQNRQPTKEEVNQWFDENPDANIAIVTGPVSGIVAFDLDSEHAIEFAEKQGGFPATVKVKTGKGYHLYMQYPGFEIRNSVNKNLDIDIRADGGYVAAPPSIHGSGRHYEWEESLSIHEIAPAPCEPWMFDYLKNIAEGPSVSKQSKERVPKPSDTRNMASKQNTEGDYAAILSNGAVEGMRNHTTTKLAGHLLAKGIAEDEVWSMLKLWNSGKNRLPLDESELRRTFNSVKNLESKNKKKEIEVVQFLDSVDKVAAEYDQQYVRVSFSADLLKNMEAKMNGGLVGGRLSVLGGIPSSGKTSLTNNIADNICLNNHPVLFFSHDDDRSDLRYRSYARFSGFDIEDFNQRRLSKSDIKAICKNSPVSSINANKYVIQQLIKVEEWPKLIEKIEKRHKKAPVIIIDYLRKLKTENNRMDERLRVDEILSNLTTLAKNYNIPILVISELARDSYKSGQRLSMASFKESGSIEYEASWLGILAAVEENGNGYNLKHDWERIIEQDGNVDLIVFKAKRGTGLTGKIPLKFEKMNMTVRDRIDCSKVDTVNAMKKQSKYD
jgi:replicative DNA helicase